MSFEIRAMEASELEALIDLDASVFGYKVEAELIESVRALVDPSRTLCAYDGELMIGSTRTQPLELTLPGGARVSMAGVTGVGTRQTHRRRGVMRRLMTEQLGRLRGGPEVLVGLGAAESQLYRRFGFGPASRVATISVDPRQAGLRPRPSEPGRLAELDRAAALAAMRPLFDRVRRGRNGGIDRPAAGDRVAYWEADKEVKGAAPIRFVTHEGTGGEVDGFLSYRLEERWEAGIPAYTLHVVELLGATPDAEIALWRHCLEHDLVARVVAERRPLDEPLLDLLADPRRLRWELVDDLHLRPVDVPSLLAARRYSREDSLVLEVRDELLEWAACRVRLEGGLEGARCELTGAAADLVLDQAALGSILLGDVAVERLWRAGLVEERTPGAVRRATAMFAWAPSPWMVYMF